MTVYQFKMRNGRRVALTSAEIAELAARDADWDAGAPARRAKKQRIADLKGDAAAIDWANRLATATPEQIDTYFANNVTNAASVIAVLKALVKLLAWRLR